MNRSGVLLLAIMAMPVRLEAATVAVEGARIASSEDRTRLVLDTTAPIAQHKIFMLSNPSRLVIDLIDTRIAGHLPKPQPGEPLMTGIRSGVRQGDDLRIVLDLKEDVRTKSFLLQPDGRYGHRLVIDLMPKNGLAARATMLAEASQGLSDHPSVRQRAARPRDVVIAIDAGHGGKDPGAIGARGTREKDVTLAIARRLAALIDREPGMRTVMIRDGDEFVALRQRIEIARKQRADLFVSIHADAFRDPSVRGSSVFTLSERGATSEAAKWLATRENQADLLAGIDLGRRNEEVAGVLVEMTQNLTMEQSSVAATRVLERLGDLGSVHQTRIQSAGFAVLKAPDIPSMLVETAFISNPEEEARLRDSAFQDRLARSIMAGIRDYFRDYPPPRTWLSQAPPPAGAREHVISNGDTLLDIARDYQVSLPSLRDANRLENDQVEVGRVLTIPES